MPVAYPVVYNWYANNSQMSVFVTIQFVTDLLIYGGKRYVHLVANLAPSGAKN